jgi:predicted HicB family RNase H-like nuclease
MAKKQPQRPAQMIVKLTERRKERYERAADRSDLSLSEWVRRVLDAECDRSETGD